MELRTLLGPSIPALGMRSAQDPSTLPDGIWSRIENMRCQNGTLKVRDGAAPVVASAIANATACRGLFSATFNGTTYQFGAFRVSSETKLYYLSGSSWTEISGVGAIFSADGELGFAVVHQEGIEGGVSSAGDVLVLGNGSAVATVSTTTLPFDTVSSVSEISAPASATQTAIPWGYQLIAPDTLVDTSRVYDSDATNDLEGTPGIGVIGYLLEVKPTVTEGSTSAIVWDVSVKYDGTFPQGLTLQKEVCLAIDYAPSEGSLWDYLGRVEALVRPTSSSTVAISGTSAAAGAITVTTGSAHGYSTGDYVYVSGVSGFALSNGVFQVTVTGATTFELDGTNATGTGTGGTARVLEWITLWQATNTETSIAFYDLDPLTGRTGFNATIAVIPTYPYEGREGWCGLRFTANGETPPGSITAQGELMVAATSGQVDGRSRFAVGLYRASSFTESVATEATPATASLMSMGGTISGSRYGWVPGSEFRTSFRIGFPGSQASTGSPTHALVYRSDPYLVTDGGTNYSAYFFDESLTLPVSEPSGGNVVYSVSETLTVTRQAKDVGSLPIPTGSIFAVANDRLFVAGIGSTTRASELWASADRDPFLFRQVPLVDDYGNQSATSATYRTFPGESVAGLLKMQGDILGVDSVLTWTDRGLYKLGGFDSRELMRAARLSEKGTRRRQTICPYDGTVWYLDTEGQARVSNGGLASQPMTLDKVDDLLSAGTITGASAVAGFYHYRLFFQESGAASVRVSLTWQQRTNEWVLDRYPFDIGAVCLHDVSPRAVMYAAEPTGKLWRLEVPSQTTENGSAIPVVFSAPEISNGMWGPVSFGTMGIITDGNVNATLTTSRYSPFDGSTTTGTLNLTTSALTTASAWRMDQDAYGGVVGTPECFSCIPSVSGSLPGGKRVRALNIVISPMMGGADRA